LQGEAEHFEFADLVDLRAVWELPHVGLLKAARVLVGYIHLVGEHRVTHHVIFDLGMCKR